MVVYKGWRAKLFIPEAQATEIGFAESVTVDIDMGAEGYFELGSKVYESVVEGNFEITGTIDRAWVDKKLLKLMGTALETMPVFNLKVTIEDTENVLSVTECRLTSTSFDIPQDGFLTTSLDFIGRNFSISGATS